jgi:hypothetical protein
MPGGRKRSIHPDLTIERSRENSQDMRRIVDETASIHVIVIHSKFLQSIKRISLVNEYSFSQLQFGSFNSLTATSLLNLHPNIPTGFWLWLSSTSQKTAATAMASLTTTMPFFCAYVYGLMRTTMESAKSSPCRTVRDIGLKSFE